MGPEYTVNSYCGEIVDDDYTLIIIHDTGRYIKIRSSIWNNIQYYIENNSEIDERLSDIFQVLLDHQIIHEKSGQPFQHRSIQLQLTSECNLNCEHCFAKLIATTGKVTYKIIDKVISLNPETLVLTGGEAMTHPDFWEIIKYIKERFNNSLTLMTNATLINKANVIDLCMYFDYIDISIDGIISSDTNRIRGEGIYTKVISAIKLLKEQDQAIGISAVKECLTDSSEKDFIEFAESLGVNYYIRSLNISGGIENNLEKLVIGGKEKYISKAKKTIREKSINCSEFCCCGMVRFSLFVDSGGYVFPCSGLSMERFKLGHINDYSEINSDYNSIVSELLNEEIFSSCRECKYLAGCWDCLSVVLNRANIPEVFSYYCNHQKLKWKSIFETH